VSESTEPQKVH